MGDEGLGFVLGLGALILRAVSLVVPDPSFALGDGGQSLWGDFTLMTKYHLLSGLCLHCELWLPLASSSLCQKPVN